jgi:hypothetical protein
MTGLVGIWQGRREARGAGGSPDPALVMAAVAAALVLAAGVAYAVVRDPGWESDAAVTLQPAPLANGNRVGLLDVFDRSGTLGTYVETISSSNTLEAAGSPPIDVEARSVPDTRVIEVVASGNGRAAVQGGLASVVDVVAAAPVEADAGERREMSLWTAEVTQSPSAAVQPGPSTPVIVAATLVMAALAGLLVLILGRRTIVLAPPPRPDPSFDAELSPAPTSNGDDRSQRRAPTRAGSSGSLS